MALAGRNVVITGGTGSLGQIVVQAFLKEGANVAVPSGGTAGDIPGAAFVGKCDLSDEKETRIFFDAAAKKTGPADVLVCLAGGYTGGKLVEETSDEDLEGQFRLNLLTVHNAARMVLGGMKDRRQGRIITVASMPALQPSAKKAAYAISKRAVVTLTEVIAQEVWGTGVTCNAIAPSIIRTKANLESMPGAESSRWVSPEEIAALILFLSSREAGSINGNVIKIYGGVS
ncbi:MAG: SDR family NAD(P)-dependent oxidoreductase [Bacteroidota bacterium]